MYEVLKKKKYYVLTNDNKYFEFKNYDTLLSWLKKNGRINKVGNNWNDTYLTPNLDSRWSYLSNTRQPVDYIVFDYYNRIINIEYLIKNLNNFSEKRCNCRRLLYHGYRKNWLGFRGGPVPGVSYKRMKTTQELCRNSWDREYARARRCKRYLPNRWDDIPSGKYDGNKSWKKQKKRKQWM
jgi:hypothetical protein